MYTQALIDALVLLGMFVVRIGVPVAITLALGYWLERKLRPQEEVEVKPRAEERRATIIPFPKAAQAASPATAKAAQVPCWDVKNCNPAARSQCAAYQRPDLPCWLALQVEGGTVREQCFDCDLYKKAQRAVI